MWTPDALAVRIVSHFQPTGRILEPCKGAGAFVRAMPSCEWCEIDEGKDFFAQGYRQGQFDWIVTNPPWSQFRPFLAQSMWAADNVVFLSLINAWFMRARVSDMRAAGFGLVEVLMLDTPPKPWPQTGFQLAAVHAKRGHRGPTIFSDENDRNPATGSKGDEHERN